MSALVFCVLIFLVAGSEVTSASRKPSCVEDTLILACPMNLSPVCGSDGNTYANECLLCVRIKQTKNDIFVMKDGVC